MILSLESIRIVSVYLADCCVVCIITRLYYLFDGIVVNHHTPSIEQCLHETNMQINARCCCDDAGSYPDLSYYGLAPQQ